MKRTAIAVAISLAAALGTPLAQAGGPRGGDFYDYAKVTRVEPIVRVVRVSTPREECWDETVTHREYGGYSRSDSYAPMLLGGIVGGVVGNQFGKGGGRDAMTIAGALLGASVGHDVGRRPYRYPETYATVEERCRVVEEYREEERVEGYHVTYRYKGETYTTRMARDPGERLRVRVAVEPAEY